MKRSLLATISAATLIAGSIFAAAPASALQTSVGGGGVCSVNVGSPSNGATSSRGTCTQSRSYVEYRDSGGTLRGVAGSWGTSSAAYGTTTMVTSRQVRAYYNGGYSNWIGY